MKKIIYGTLFLTTVGIGIISCEKEEIETKTNPSTNTSEMTSTKAGNVGSEIRYIPTSDAIADQLVNSLLNNTMTGNPSVQNYTDTNNDPVPDEGAWAMEAAANYLTNKYLAHTSSDEVIEIITSVENYLSTGSIIKMDDKDMYRKFDGIFSNISAQISGTNKRPIAVDFKILDVDQTETVLQVFIVVGEPVLPTATWPTTNSSANIAANELESKLNSNFFEQLMIQHYPQYTAGNLYTSTWLTNGPDFYFSNVNFLNQIIDPKLSQYDLSAYGCPTNDCLWGNTSTGVNVYITHPYYQPIGSSDRLFPATEYPTYYNRGKLLIQNNYSQTTQVSNALGVFGCDYGLQTILDLNAYSTDWHYIGSIYAGIFHVM